MAGAEEGVALLSALIVSSILNPPQCSLALAVPGQR